MWEYMAMPFIIGGIFLLIVIVIVANVCKGHRDFIDNAYQLEESMSKSEVIDIMGEPTSIEKDGKKQILIWEKSQWKGIQNGGTVTRGVKVVIVNNKVVSISNKNLDKSTFW